MLAGIITSLGYYLAISQHRNPDSARERDAQALAMAPLKLDESAVDTSAGPMRFEHAPSPARPMSLRMVQTSRIGAANGAHKAADTAEIRSEITLDFEMSVAPQGELSREVDPEEREFSSGTDLSGEVLGVTYDYHQMRAEVFADDDKSIGSSITTQVAELIRGSITRIFIRPNGERAGYEWVEVPNPQARRALMVIRDAQTFLTPRFMPDEVNPGDTWSYQRPMSIEDPETGLKSEGAITVENRFAGLLTADDGQQFALLRQTLGGQAKGELDGEELRANLELSGSGAATLLVDPKTGAVEAADLDFERAYQIDSAAQPSTITLELRPAGGLRLQAP